jgi:acyl carrier protein
MAIEDRFQLEISDEDAQKLKNVGEIWEYIKQKSGN